MTFEIQQADWPGFTEIMGDKGGCGGCWCMLWRQSRREMDAGMGEGNRLAMRSLFAEGRVPGLIARMNGEAVGWIQLDEREAFPRLATSRVLKPVDKEPVWSVACFLVDKRFRKRGLSRDLLRAACRLAADRGAKIIEGYPVDTPQQSYPAVYAWTGFFRAFLEVGFTEVARRSPTRPILRKHL